jgi:hypothetical protein
MQRRKMNMIKENAKVAPSMPIAEPWKLCLLFNVKPETSEKPFAIDD